MTPEEWERIKAAFEAALDLNPDERSHLLESTLQDRPDLRAIVDNLLEQYARSGDFLDTKTYQQTTAGLPAFVPNQLVASRFRVRRVIAIGGMGEVYEVFDERLRIRVALKTIRTDLGADREAYERFKREVWVTREVAHPGICRVYELIEHFNPERPDGRPIPCLTMAFLDGENLQARLKRTGPMPLDEALPLIRQICAALHELHVHGIIHRDLKPSNIMIVNDQYARMKAVLTDFGLARPFDQSFNTTVAGDAKPGAPFFMAPETIRGDPESVASDIYALGLVIDEMVTKSRAFTAESIHALYYQKLWDDPVAPSLRADNLPRRWEDVILRCMAKDPGNRYSAAIDIAADLERTDEPAPEPIKAQRPGLWRRSRRLVLAISAPLVLLILLVPIALWSQSPVSLLVMPVLNQSGVSDLDPLSTGTTMEMLRRLTRLDDVRVYQVPSGSQEDAELKSETMYSLATYLYGNTERIRIIAKLSENRTGKVMWVGDAESEIRNALVLQRDITTRLVEKLEDQVASGTGPLVSPVRRVIDPVFRSWRQHSVAQHRASTGNVAAFQKYVRAQMLFEQRTPLAARQAMEILKQTVAEAPDFALAWTLMSDLQRLLMEHATDQEVLELRTHAREYAERAVTIDPELPEAQAALGAVMQIEWEWTRADEAYRKAIDLHPNYARARRQYAGLLLQLGQTDEALRMFQEALRLDPFDYPSQSSYGFALLYSGKFREAVQHLEALVQKHDLLSAQIVLGLAYALMTSKLSGAEATAMGDKALRQAVLIEDRERKEGSTAADPLKWSAMIYALTNAYLGRQDQARTWLERMEQNRRLGRGSAFSVAAVHAALRDYDQALDELEMSAAYREKELTNVRAAPYFTALHKHPRFRRLLATMRLPTT